MPVRELCAVSMERGFTSLSILVETSNFEKTNGGMRLVRSTAARPAGSAAGSRRESGRFSVSRSWQAVLHLTFALQAAPRYAGGMRRGIQAFEGCKEGIQAL